MKCAAKTCFLLVFIFSASWLRAQTRDSTKTRDWSLHGYVKFLHTAVIPNDLNAIQDENLFHNRLNFEWKPQKEFEFHASLRTRLIYGDIVKLTPGFGKQISTQSNDWANLDALIIDKKALVLHTVFDRLYGQWTHKKWEVSLGRQRVNWGISTLWNPNDLFNTYSFTDFDYEERPGSDALRVTYYRKWNSSIEFAGKMAKSWEETVLAMRYKFNIKVFDIQLIAGKYHRQMALGGGFAGNLWQGSLKGEFTDFIPALPQAPDQSFTGTLEYSRSTPYNLLYGFGGLYNSLGKETPLVQLFNFYPDARNLYPYKYSAFGQVQYQFTPLFSGTLAAVYSFNKLNPLFFNPSFTYSAAENFDIDLVGQVTFEKFPANQDFHSDIQAVFLRFKFSF